MALLSPQPQGPAAFFQVVSLEFCGLRDLGVGTEVGVHDVVLLMSSLKSVSAPKYISMVIILIEDVLAF